MKNVKKLMALISAFAIFVGIGIPSNTVYAASGDTVVYITKTGECYHSSGCSSLRKSKIETTLQSAIDRGYRACSKCKPPVLDASPESAPTTNNVSQASTNNAAVQTEVTYVGKANTMKFHKPSCYSASQISQENYLEFTCDRDDVVNQGYVPCKKCNP